MRSRPSPNEELDLVPIMNLVTILIPFLLFSAQFVSLSAIDSTLPAIADTVPTPPNPEETLDLSIAITAGGYGLTAGIPLDGPTSFPRNDGQDWDTEGLTDALVALKDRFPDEETVILVPEGDIPYEILIQTMDAARRSGDQYLFPSVVMAGGAS